MAERTEATTLGQILEQARDTLTVRRVFGEAYQSEGCLVVPVAAVRGAGGGGGGSDDKGNAGSGGGFGMQARPVGIVRIKGDEVTWIPTVDTTRVAVMGQILGLVALLVMRSVVKRLVRRR